MIKLSLPLPTADLYANLEGGMLFGPVSVNKQPVTQVTTYRHRTDFLSEHPGMFRENFVKHSQASADISYVPMDDIIPEPTSQYLNQVRFWYKVGVSNASSLYPLGFAQHQSTSMVKGITTYEQYAVEIPDPSTLIVYRLQAYKSSATLRFVSCYCKVYSITSITGTSGSYSVTTYGLSPESNQTTRAGDWSFPRSYKEIVDAVSANLAVAPQPTSTYALTLRSRRSGIILSMQQVQARVDAAVDLLYGFDSKPERIHYGELAHQATLDWSVNDVNMLEFLRDIREPIKMIPKLKFLRNIPMKELQRIKHLSGDYLTVKYGILPTISDIQKIVDAFSRVKPHLDRFGYKTGDAGYQSNTSYLDNKVTVSLWQHIKIAVANEESMLLALVNRIEEIGILPNFQNLWELIPLSFVVDWLVDVGDLFEHLDSRLRLLRYDIKYVTMSDKTSASLRLVACQSDPYAGQVDLVRYSRWVTKKCPVPPLAPQISDLSTSSSHWLEAIALIIQRLKL